MQEVKVAIVIANYNTGHFVVDAIKSALAQTYPAKGIFIVDDCSVDNSLEIIKSYFGFCSCGCHEKPDIRHCIACCDKTYEQFNILIEENEYFKLFKLQEVVPVYLFSLKKNVGRGQVRNFPIAWALNNGYHLVQVLDSDDIMYPSKVEELSQVMLQDPEHIGLVYADYIIQNVETGVSTYESKPAFNYLNLNRGLSMIHSGALINGSALAKVGLYDGNLQVAEDLSLFKKIVNANFMAVNVAKPLTLVRSHSMDSTHNVNPEIWKRDFQRAMTGV